METPLIRACHFNNIDVAKQLIEAGALSEKRSMQDMSPFLTAYTRVKGDMIDLLLEKGAKVNYITNNKIETETIEKIKDETERAKRGDSIYPDGLEEYIKNKYKGKNITPEI